MRISDWSSDVCSSDLSGVFENRCAVHGGQRLWNPNCCRATAPGRRSAAGCPADFAGHWLSCCCTALGRGARTCMAPRSEEHTSELQSLMRSSYAVFCLKKNKQQTKDKEKKNSNKRTTKNIAQAQKMSAE